MVPHVNRQEVYAGKRLNESYYDERIYGSNVSEEDMVNSSPIDIFEGNKAKSAQTTKFPLYQYATRYMETLQKGDCMFIPAFVFYSYKG